VGLGCREGAQLLATSPSSEHRNLGCLHAPAGCTLLRHEQQWGALKSHAVKQDALLDSLKMICAAHPVTIQLSVDEQFAAPAGPQMPLTGDHCQRTSIQGSLSS
jgi:hypothetical protein